MSEENFIKLRQAKAKEEEISRAFELVHFINGAFAARTFDRPMLGEEAFDTEDPEQLKEFLNKCGELSKGLMRVVAGFDVLVNNCCDPDKDTLEWKPEIERIMTQYSCPLLEEFLQANGITLSSVQKCEANRFLAAAWWYRHQTKTFVGRTIDSFLGKYAATFEMAEVEEPSAAVKVLRSGEDTIDATVASMTGCVLDDTQLLGEVTGPTGEKLQIQLVVTSDEDDFMEVE